MSVPAGSGRIQTLDILRGIALLGMILVHFHQNMEVPAGMPEDAIGWIIWVGVEEKAWATFAFLFGVGFAILLRSREQRGDTFTAFYLRRLLGLALFGFAAESLFGFRVLLDYAIWGVPLLLVRKWSTRSLLAMSIVSAAALPLYRVALALSQSTFPGHAAALPIGAGPTPFQMLVAARLQPDYIALVAARLRVMAATYLNWQILIPDHNLSLFILGLLALRHGLFSETGRHIRIVVTFMVIGFASWAAFWLLLPHIPENFAPAGVVEPVRFGLGLVSDQWLAFTYVGAAILLLCFFPVWQRRLALFGIAGRMALTNYMLQIAVLDLLGSSYGFGLKMRPLAVPLAAALLFAVEVLFSRYWLSRFRYGPLEWIWRSFTYGKRQPMRLQKTSTLAAGA